MAFQTVAGYGNLSTGAFSPVIYSKKVQLAFRKSSVAQAITNTDYMGEINAFGDTVRIIKEPEVTVRSYARGTQVQAQDLQDEDFSLVVDKANYFAFKLDDIEAAHSHVNWMQMATDRAGYRLKDQFDAEVLAYVSGYKQAATFQAGDPGSLVNDQVSGSKAISTAGNDELLTTMKLIKGNFSQITTASAGDHSVPLQPRLGGLSTLPNDRISPLQAIARMSRQLDLQNVDSDGRWLVVDPIFVEMLKDDDSRLLNADFGGSGLQNGLVVNNLHGFRVYVSNNLPRVGTGPATAGVANQNSNFGVIVAGHDSAACAAEQINKTETYRDPESFADICRGMHLYGRKVLRPEALVSLKYNVA